MTRVNTRNINEIRDTCQEGDRFLWLGYGFNGKDVQIEITHVSDARDWISGTVVKKDGTLGKLSTCWMLYKGEWSNAHNSKNHSYFERI